MKSACLEVIKCGMFFVAVLVILVAHSSECKIMKNRKFLGSLPEQSVRQKSKPFIVEMENQ